MGRAKVNVKTIADCPLEDLQSRVLPVLRCRAVGCCRLKGGRFSWLIWVSAGSDCEAASEHGTWWWSHISFLIFKFMFAARAVRNCKRNWSCPERSGTVPWPFECPKRLSAHVSKSGENSGQKWWSSGEIYISLVMQVRQCGTALSRIDTADKSEHAAHAEVGWQSQNVQGEHYCCANAQPGTGCSDCAVLTKNGGADAGWAARSWKQGSWHSWKLPVVHLLIIIQTKHIWLDLQIDVKYNNNKRFKLK
jgi:hypothetical protein